MLSVVSLALRRPLCLALAACAVLLSACGGGGGGGETGKSEALVPRASALPPSATLAGICTLEGEKAFTRSYLDEAYLWWNEITEVDAAPYSSVADHFQALLVRTPDASGRPRDRFSAVLSTERADALLGSAAAADTLAAPTRSVPLVSVVASPAQRRVGYLLLDDQRRGAVDALIDAFSALQSADIQDLVLDLRHNSGGYLYVAQAAASMVTGPAADGRVFEALAYSGKRQAEGAGSTFRFTGQVEVAESRYPRGHALPRLGLPRVYVLASGMTCSASESIVNGLRGIDVEVVLVGETTCGKPYGFRRKDNCGSAYFAIEFQGTNAKGFGDYAAGFAPQCAVAEDYSQPLGSDREPLLAAALQHIDTGICPAPAGGRKQGWVPVDEGLGGRLLVE